MEMRALNGTIALSNVSIISESSCLNSSDIQISSTKITATLIGRADPNLKFQANGSILFTGGDIFLTGSKLTMVALNGDIAVVNPANSSLTLSLYANDYISGFRPGSSDL